MNNPVPLSPCPFCGDEGARYEECDIRDREGIPGKVLCMKCGATGPVEYNEDERGIHSRVAWNERKGTKLVQMDASEFENCVGLARLDARATALEGAAKECERTLLGDHLHAYEVPRLLAAQIRALKENS